MFYNSVQYITLYTKYSQILINKIQIYFLSKIESFHNGRKQNNSSRLHYVLAKQSDSCGDEGSLEIRHFNFWSIVQLWNLHKSLRLCAYI